MNDYIRIWKTKIYIQTYHAYQSYKSYTLTRWIYKLSNYESVKNTHIYIYVKIQIYEDWENINNKNKQINKYIYMYI